MPINRAFVHLLANERAKTLNLTRLQHQSEMSEALGRMEDQVIAAAISDLPLKEGRLVDTQSAIDFRVDLSRILKKEMGGFKRVAKPGYDAAVKKILEQNGKLDLPDTLTKAELGVIRQLKTLSFQGFDDIAKDHITQMSKIVFDSTVGNVQVGKLIKDLQVNLQGGYASADSDKADDLREFISDNRADPLKEAQVAKASRELHALGRDIVGVSLRGRANQMVFDSLFQFAAASTEEIAKGAGLDHFLYSGAIRGTSRQWCRNHVEKVLTGEEVEGWNNSKWQGKAPGDPFIVRGGYNCRHIFVPVDPEWLEE